MLNIRIENWIITARNGKRRIDDFLGIRVERSHPAEIVRAALSRTNDPRRTKSLVYSEHTYHTAQISAVSRIVDRAIPNAHLHERVLYVNALRKFLRGTGLADNADFGETRYSSAHAIELPPVNGVWGAHYAEEDGGPEGGVGGKVGAIYEDAFGGPAADECGWEKRRESLRTRGDGSAGIDPTKYRELQHFNQA